MAQIKANGVTFGVVLIEGDISEHGVISGKVNEFPSTHNSYKSVLCYYQPAS